MNVFLSIFDMSEMVRHFSKAAVIHLQAVKFKLLSSSCQDCHLYKLSFSEATVSCFAAFLSMAVGFRLAQKTLREREREREREKLYKI